MEVWRSSEWDLASSLCGANLPTAGQKSFNDYFQLLLGLKLFQSSSNHLIKNEPEIMVAFFASDFFRIFVSAIVLALLFSNDASKTTDSFSASVLPLVGTPIEKKRGMSCCFEEEEIEPHTTHSCTYLVLDVMHPLSSWRFKSECKREYEREGG